MSPADRLSLTQEGDRHVVVTRRFSAPPAAVYKAHLDPEILKRWMLGPEGWSMPVCLVDPVPGGTFRHEWTDGQGGGFYMTGEFIELVPDSKIVHIERMHLPDPTPDNRVETRFEVVGDGTLMTMRMTLPDEETRAQMLASGMEGGMNASYTRLDGVVESR